MIEGGDMCKVCTPSEWREDIPWLPQNGEKIVS